VEYAGCKAVLLPEPVCVLGPDRTIQLWVGAPLEARIEIAAGDGRLAAAGEPRRGGLGFSLKIPAGAEVVDVLAEAEGRGGSWTLAFAAPRARRGKPRDVLREVDEKTILAYNYILARDLAAVRKTLNGLRLRLPAKAPAESRYYLAYYQGLLAEREGDYRSALAEVQKAVEIAARVKLNRFQWLAEEEMALLLRGVGRSGESAQLFEHLRRKPFAKDACDVAQLLNNQAWSTLLAHEAGERLADPAPLLERALEMRERCTKGRPEKKVNILINLALAHLQEGRLPQAKALLARVRRLEAHPPLPHTLWRLDLEARLALREGRPAEARRLYVELGELASRTSSPEGRLRAVFGQARSHQASGEPAAALETLRAAEDLLAEQSLQIPIHEGRETFIATRQAVVNLHVGILVDEGRNAEALDVARHARSRVLRQLAHGERLANLPPDQRARWEHLLSGYQQKRAVLEERARDEWRLPVSQVRRERAAREAEAEAANRLLDQAFLVLRNPRERPEDPWPPPRAGELILAYHPLPQGWVGFAADGKSVMTRRFELPPDLSVPSAELARRLLLPFRAAIEKAARIRVLPSGPLQQLDFHALPFGGDILLAGRPVIYGLDFPVFARSAPAPGRRALLVADPRDDLPGALEEAASVRRALASGSRRWVSEELKSSAATADAVRSRLAAADLLHYAGHGTFSGFGGWESSLLLAEETRLTLGDFLALVRVPAWVVLSACDTGRSAAETPVEGLGLAHAFLLAGSRAVVASNRPADDRTVPAFFADLYRQWDREPDLAVALQRAQLAWRQRDPRADWASFRLFEP
jgi:CHAT domain-containing protein